MRACARVELTRRDEETGTASWPYFNESPFTPEEAETVANNEMASRIGHGPVAGSASSIGRYTSSTTPIISCCTQKQRAMPFARTDCGKISERPFRLVSLFLCEPVLRTAL